MEGCQANGDFSTCDNGIRAEGDGCAEKPDKRSYACTADLTTELVCRGRKVEVLRTCRGPRGCHLEGETVGCDDTLGEVDDPCVNGSREGRFACSVDVRTEVECAPGSSRFRVSRVCLGPKHCWINESKVYCDQRLAHEGAICRPAHTLACAEDGSAELECSEGGVWTKKRDCKSACVNRTGTVECP